MRAIIVDSREQRPWEFPEWVKTRVRALPFGDYALEGDGRFAIERKSLDDFVGTVFSGWERFKRELERMAAAGCVARIIIVEADFCQLMYCSDGEGGIVPPGHNHPRISPAAVCSRIAELAMMGVTTLFCRDGGHAAYMAYSLLSRREMDLEKGYGKD